LGVYEQVSKSYSSRAMSCSYICEDFAATSRCCF
jgi:hypothetical protein